MTKRSQICLVYLTTQFLGVPYMPDVDYLSQVAQLLGYSWYCCTWIYNGAEDCAGYRMGMVSTIQRFCLIMADVGNLGGLVWPGNSFGPGLLLPLFSGSLATSTTPKAGAFRPSAVPFRSEYHTLRR